jgi:lipopolysaccharide/colanic/teichoic acid biosynthesis glycosyltransferase
MMEANIENKAQLPWLGYASPPLPLPLPLPQITKTAAEPLWWQKIDGSKSLLSKQQYLIVKRLMDLGLILISAPFLVIIGLLCALLIKLESPNGSVLFLQQRTGKDGERFSIYKFRTMVPNAEELKAQLAHQNELAYPDFKVTNDPRITKVGKFLRKSSLDELPQLINVLRGEMSLIGPRPTSFKSETYKLWHTERLEAQPGLTGLWQVIGRGTMEFDDRVRLDIAYIHNRCLTFDILILFYTVWIVIKQEGAY